MGFSNHYFLALLCVKLTFCGPVKDTDSNLVKKFEEGVNKNCTIFPIPKNEALMDVCDAPVPDLKDKKKVKHELKYSPNPLMCYSAMSNMMTLCPAHQELNVTKTTTIDDIDGLTASKFCGDAASVSIKQDCGVVHKDNKFDKSDCEQLKKVLPATLTNNTLCEKHCIIGGDISPVCQYLYFSTKAVLEIFYDKVAIKPTQKTVIPPAEIKKTPLTDKPKSSTTESKKKTEVIPSNEEKEELENKGSAEGAGVESIDDRVDAEVENIDTENAQTNKTNTIDHKAVDDISKQPGETTTTILNESPDETKTTVVSDYTAVTFENDLNQTVLPINDVNLSTDVNITNQPALNDQAGESSFTEFGGSNKGGISSFESSTAVSNTERSWVQTDTDLGKVEKKAHADSQVQTNGSEKDTKQTDDSPIKTETEKGKIVLVENTMHNEKSKSMDDTSSSFFSYFILLSIVAIVAYLVFHNKQKILALILEGRRRQGTRRRSGGKEYRKLDSNLEDTMNSESYTSGQHVIY